MPIASLLWRRLDCAGHDAARLHLTPSGLVLSGTAVFDEGREPCALEYRVICDEQGRTVSARVVGWRGGRSIDIDITSDPSRRWALNGRPCPAARGCDDLDLSFTPATNLLPIRRLRLNVGDRAAVRSAWLRFPDVGLEPLDQTYERVAEAAYAYTSGGGAFAATLQTNADGFVTSYPGLWLAEPAP